MVSGQVLRSLTKKAVIAQQTEVLPEQNLLNEELAKVKSKVLTAAENGNWEIGLEYPESDKAFLTHLSVALKQEMSDVMVISDFGRKKITISWYASNEV